MFIYRSRFLTRGEVWFDDQPDGRRVDWIYHRQRSTPLPDRKCKPFYTRLIDMQKNPAEMFADMDEKTQRRITEAQRLDHLRCEPCNAKDTLLIDRIEQMWNQFARAHHTELLDRPWLNQFCQAEALDLVAAKDPEGTVLAYHLVLMTPNRARQLIAISPFRAVPSVAWRNTISRANSIIHWHNFQVFRQKGIRYFDFGGWYRGSTDIRLLGMNTFKKGFGGAVACEYDCEQPVTFKGWLILKLAEILARLKQRRFFTRAESEVPNHAPAAEKHKVSPAFR